ncbi:MAG: ATP-binding cassette domain-containing protein [Bacteroidales bacterium]
MSERILKALMQLFAIIADPKSNASDRRPVVESFLEQQLNKELVEEYLGVFDYYYQSHQQRFKSSIKSEKRTASSSVKVLTICTEINKELTQKQKLVVVIRLLEFINSDKIITPQESEFVATVADTFHIPLQEYESLRKFVLNQTGEVENSNNILVVNSAKTKPKSNVNHLSVESINGEIIVYSLKSANMHIFTFRNENELYLNNQLLDSSKVHILSPGSSIKNTRIKPIYYSDIIRIYNYDKTKSAILLEAVNLEYRFRSGAKGLHHVNFSVQSGNLVGIIGASGSGKTTLLNVLNGNQAPSSGEVYINGINLHKEHDRAEGIIGYVSQDDMLIDELTVYQNLYYSAKLCFSNYNEFQLLRLVLRLLKSLGLYEIKDMKVGTPLNKKISGGQRKRLNIALELIREPAILFLDEPTSGLSSRDSENIVDLLKELALKGKLIFMVIHQPSSEIFKRFDRLLLLDKGGYLIYDGDPVESISYFKSRIRQADWNESECSLCGNVNPEQLFNIVEAQVVDEYGNLTQTRKTFPKEWSQKFESYRSKTTKKSKISWELPEITFKIPNKLKQFQIYLTRDFLAKLTNRQYLIVNLFETPLLALILAYITRYYNIDPSNEFGYNLMENSNLPVFIFMSVIVAIFIGMTVSAQEIIKDRLILKRESFVNLSRTSYLFSKIFLLLGLSAYQALAFVLIGNSIMAIKGMYIHYWIVLFSVHVNANLIGLNISDAIKTSVTIYIIIPFLIVPQIVLSGIIIKFDNINPSISSPNKIPLYGEIMTSRWAYEALAVYQFKNNAYEKNFYAYDREKSISEYKKDYWLKILENKLNSIQSNLNDKSRLNKVESDILLIRNEIGKELNQNKNVALDLEIRNIGKEKIDTNTINKISAYFSNLKTYYNNRYNASIRLKDEQINKRLTDTKGKENFKKLKREYANERLSEFVRNSDGINYVKEYNGHLYQKVDPIFQIPQSNFIKAHFYAPSKKIFGRSFNTIWVNVLVIWLMNIVLFLSLKYRILKLTLNFADYIRQVRQNKINKTNKNKKINLQSQSS